MSSSLVGSEMCIRDSYKARKGLVVAEILDGSCEGCGAMVPPQSINEALSQNIVFCGNCSRFLYKLEN